MNNQEYILLLEAVGATQDGEMIGQPERGSHYGLCYVLRNFGVRASNSQDAIQKGKELLRQYEKGEMR